MAELDNIDLSFIARRLDTIQEELAAQRRESREIRLTFTGLIDRFNGFEGRFPDIDAQLNELARRLGTLQKDLFTDIKMEAIARDARLEAKLEEMIEDTINTTMEEKLTPSAPASTASSASSTSLWRACHL